MGFNIGPTISVQGEAAFNAAMNQMRQNMKYVSAEAGAAMSVFGKNEKSIESLTTQNEQLSKALSVQKQGIKDIQEAMDKLIAAGVSPTCKQYKQLKANLDNVTAAANKTEREIKDNNEAMSDLNKKSSGLGDMVKNLADKFGIPLPAGVKKATDALNNVSASTVAFVGLAAKMISSLVNISAEAAGTADEILTLSSTTGMSTKQIQEFNYMSELVDVSTDTLSSSLSKMVKNMDSARKGTGDAAEAYQKLHVKVTGANGQLRDSSEVFYEVIDRLGKVKNETERDALAMAIFGKSAQELNPLIEAGSDSLKEYADEADKLGYVLSDEALGQLGNLQNMMDKFNKQTEAVKDSLALALLPVLTKFFEIIAKIPPSAITTIAIIATVIVTVIALVKAIQSIQGVVGTVGKLLDPANAKMTKTTLIIMGVVAALIALAVVIAVILGKTKELNESMSSMGQSVGNMQRTATGSVPHYATGTSYHTGGLAILGEMGPELVSLPRGTQVSTNRQTMAMLGASSSNTYNIVIDAKNVQEFNDIVRIAQRERITARAGLSGRR